MVFAVDITGSMSDQIQDVHDAISAYAHGFCNSTDHRFGLVLFPAPHGPGWAQLGSPAMNADQHREDNTGT